MTTLQLARAAAGGDEAAAAHLYRRHEPMVRGLVARSVRDPSMVDDICQDAWLRVFRALHTFRGDAAFSTWLHTVVRNVVISWVRRPRLVTFETDYVADTARAAHDPAELRLDLERGLATLPAGMRRVLVLHDIEGFTHQEIADTLGIAEGTSKSQLFKARAKLREQLVGARPALHARPVRHAATASVA